MARGGECLSFGVETTHKLQVIHQSLRQEGGHPREGLVWTKANKSLKRVEPGAWHWAHVMSAVIRGRTGAMVRHT